MQQMKIVLEDMADVILVTGRMCTLVQAGQEGLNKAQHWLLLPQHCSCLDRGMAYLTHMVTAPGTSPPTHTLQIPISFSPRKARMARKKEDGGYPNPWA